MRSIRFSTVNQKDFVKILKTRVDEYFKTTGKSTKGNMGLFVKSFVMLSIYFTPYILIVGGFVTHPLAVTGLGILMGLGMALIGLCVMHDALHGSFSKKKIINDIMGYSANLVGVCGINWKIQHNVLHHTFTNVYGMDQDLETGRVMRFSPHQPPKKYHRFQHIYSWLLYMLLTINWVLFKDIRQLTEFNKRGLLKSQKTNATKEWFIFGITKLSYVFYAVLVPLLFTDLAWWGVLLFVIPQHLTAGLILSCIFQPAHVVPVNEHPLPEDGKIENSWAVHQLETTADYATKSPVFSWFVGGLNFQVVHHLFPSISHVHYRKLSKIVRDTASEYNLPYHSLGSYFNALLYHGKMLHAMGRTS